MDPPGVEEGRDGGLALTRNICDLVTSFASNPRALRDAAAARGAEIVSHLEACASCMTVLEGARDAETVFEALASEGRLLTEEARRSLDRLVVADMARSDEVRETVTLALLPGLGDQSRIIAERYDPLQLYAATEALSLLLRRSGDVDDRPSVRGITLRPDGSAITRRTIVSASAVAMEVARFTDLWTRKGEVRLPSKEAVELSGWLFQAARDQRNLLRHFRVAVPSRSIGLGGRQYLPLVALSASERLDEPFQRWRPARRERFEAFCIARRMKDTRWTVATLPASALDNHARGQVLVASLREAEASVAFFADGMLLTHAHAVGTRVKSAALGSLAEGVVACRPAYIGEFRSLTFNADSVELTGRGRLRAEAERVAFPEGVA